MTFGGGSLLIAMVELRVSRSSIEVQVRISSRVIGTGCPFYEEMKVLDGSKLTSWARAPKHCRPYAKGCVDLWSHEIMCEGRWLGHPC